MNIAIDKDFKKLFPPLSNDAVVEGRRVGYLGGGSAVTSPT